MSLLKKNILSHNLKTFAERKQFFSAAPHNLHVTEAKSKDLDGLWLLKYDQVKTNFDEPFCKEARGIIFDGDQVVCYPFKKFFNAGEKHADTIDWSTARVQHKYDGSIIKVYWLEQKENRVARWMVATNGTIDARTAMVDDQNGISFFDLFEEARTRSGFDYNRLDKDCTYMFELMHPKSLIVIRYTEPKLVHIGTRNNKTFVESYEPIGVEQAETFPLHNLEECLAAAERLGQSQEGFVVVDANWNRIKVKGSTYLTLHHTLTNNHLSTEEAAASLFLKNEQSEIVAYQDNPEMVEICRHIKEIEQRLAHFLSTLEKTFNDVEQKKLTSRKEIATTIKLASPKNFAILMARVTYEEKNKGNSLLPIKEFFKQNLFAKLGTDNKKIDRATLREFLEIIK